MTGLSDGLESRTLKAGAVSPQRGRLLGERQLPEGASETFSARAGGALPERIAFGHAGRHEPEHHGPEQRIVVAGESESSGRAGSAPLHFPIATTGSGARGRARCACVPDAPARLSGAHRASDPGATWRSHRTEASRESIPPAAAEQRAFARRSSVCRSRLKAICPRRRSARHVQGDPPRRRVVLRASVLSRRWSPRERIDHGSSPER